MLVSHSRYPQQKRIRSQGVENYIRLTYASTTTSKPATIRDDLVAILSEAQRHNFNHQLNGVLFYGNDYFFQCIEGEKRHVDILYEKLLKDPRHKDIMLLSYKPISKPRFVGWNMKYVLQEPAILDFFSSNQWSHFNPYALDDDLIEPFLNILYRHNQSNPGEREEVVGPEAVRGNVISYKYAMFVIMMAILILGIIYIMNANASYFGW